MLELLNAIKAKIIVPTIIFLLGVFGISIVTPPQSDVSLIKAPEKNIVVTENLPVATSTVKNLIATKTPLISKSEMSSPKTAPEPVLPKTLIPTEELNTKVRAAMVNIFCTTKTGGDFQPITGSGIIVDPRGLILTNAHVAQYFLLRDYIIKDFVSCVGRAGSPAMPTYDIGLIYMPKIWLNKNARGIKDERPLGTGENDYAFLFIKGGATQNPLPSPLSFIEMDPDQKNILEIVPELLVGYPAGLLGGIEAARDLWLSSSPATISKLYYFSKKENIDAFGVEGNILSQKGVSGGAAVSQWTGKLNGIPTTVTEGKTTGERELVAITLAHVERRFKMETGKTVSEFFSGDLRKIFEDFNKNSFPELSKILIDAANSTSTPAN